MSTANVPCPLPNGNPFEATAMNFRLRRGRIKRPVHKYRVRFKYVRTRE